MDSGGDIVEISDEDSNRGKLDNNPKKDFHTMPINRSHSLVVTPIKIQGTSSELPYELQKQSQARPDGSQILTFTTKDIRLGDPHLMNYIQVTEQWAQMSQLI